MGFSVYGRMGSGNQEVTAGCPMITRNYGLYSNLGTRRSSAVDRTQFSYNPKKTAKKDNGMMKKVLTALGLVAAAVLIHKGHKQIDQAAKAVGNVAQEGAKQYSKYCPNMSAGFKGFYEAAKFPFRVLATPFKFIANTFAKK